MGHWANQDFLDAPSARPLATAVHARFGTETVIVMGGMLGQLPPSGIPSGGLLPASGDLVRRETQKISLVRMGRW